MNSEFRSLVGMKAHYVAELAFITAALRLREEDVERLQAKKAQAERRLAEINEEITQVERVSV